MTTPKPPPRTLQPAEERKIQLFLERAAPIVLEDPQLTEERWQFLAALANDLDLTADQLRSTIDDLLSRGVIKNMAVTPPKPPPLPGRGGNATKTPPLVNNATEDFSLSPPGAPPPVQNALPTAPSESARTSNVPDKSVTVAPPAVITIRAESPREKFLERAGAILAEQRGWNPKCQSLLAAAAQDFGLSESESREALETLHQPAEPKSANPAPNAAAEKLSATRWRVEGAPAPIPPPPPKSPPETFLDFLRPSLAAVRDPTVSQELEQRLIAHGRRVLGLSQVYARHLLLEVVAERKMRLASGSDDATPSAEQVTPPADPRLGDFVEAAKPILAVHRGLNAQSRVFLNALARERGLTEQEVERALGTFVPREAEDPLDRIHKERLVPFRAHVEASLTKATRGILTPSLNDKLVNAGIELFGLSGERASEAIRETTEKLQLPVITYEQAEKHLTDLLTDILSAGTSLTRAQRDRIELEGAQWGLAPARMANLIDEHVRQSALQVRSEQRITQWALSGAVLAIVFVVLFLIWTAISRSNRHSTTAPATTSASPAVVETTPVKELSWIDQHSDFSISVINARSDLPLLRKPLTDLSSNDAARRDTAYDAIVAYFLFQALDETRRTDLAELLSYCVALDPSETSTGKLLNGLLHDVSEQTEKASLEAAAFQRMFWGVKTVAAGLARAKGKVERVTQIVAALHRAVGVTPDPAQPAAELEQLCSRSLAERLFRSLIAAASGSLTNAAPLHAALVLEATKYLDAARLDKFNSEFLFATLSKEPNQWQSYQDLLRQASASRDPLAVLKLVELYEATTSTQLRDFLGQVLLVRTSGTPPGQSVEEVAAFVRQSLGISDTQDPDGIWTKFSREARGVLESAKSPPDPTNPLLAEVLKLAHYTTLACAFAQNEWSNAAIVEWRKAGPPQPDAGMSTKPAEESSEPARATPPATMDRATQEALRVTIAALTARRAQPADRIAAVASLARLTEQAPDLSPEMAAAIASYLLNSKSSTEHVRVLEQLPPLAKWNQLLVALGDRLEDASLTDEHLQSLMTSLVGREIPIAGVKAGRTVARREVWHVLMRRLGNPETPTRPATTIPENAASLLANAYATQARLLGITLPESSAKGRDPQVTLRAMVDDYVSRLTAAKLTDAQRAELTSIPHELAALEFLAGNNDVQRFVALERAWLRLLALETARRNEPRAAEAKELVTSLQQKDQQAKHVLSQLRDGQAAQLQMWLLIGRRG